MDDDEVGSAPLPADFLRQNDYQLGGSVVQNNEFTGSVRSCTHVQSSAKTTDPSSSRAECLVGAFASSLPSVFLERTVQDAECPMHASAIAPHDASPRPPAASPGLHGTTHPAVRSPPFNGFVHSAACRKYLYRRHHLVYTPRHAVPSPCSELVRAYAAAAKTCSPLITRLNYPRPLTVPRPSVQASAALASDATFCLQYEHWMLS